VGVIVQKELPVISMVPFDSSGWYLRRVFRWLFYTRTWVMEEDWYHILFNLETIVIPKGFRFDGASIPKLFRPLISPTGVFFLPGIIHDYAYKYNKLWKVTVKDGEEEPSLYMDKAGKWYWDYLFRRECYVASRLPLLAKLTWAAPALFGFFAWYKHRRAELKYILRMGSGLKGKKGA